METAMLVNVIARKDTQGNVVNCVSVATFSLELIAMHAIVTDQVVRNKHVIQVEHVIARTAIKDLNAVVVKLGITNMDQNVDNVHAAKKGQHDVCPMVNVGASLALREYFVTVC